MPRGDPSSRPGLKNPPPIAFAAPLTASRARAAIALRALLFLFEASLAQPIQKVIDVSRIRPIPPKHACGKFQVRVHAPEFGERGLRLLDPAELSQPRDDIA
jgi:hypothetical protein